MFKGIFGGSRQDPMKMATDMNTAVTAQNSAALATLTAILAGAMGMSAPAVAAPAGIGGISLPSISAPAVSGAAGAVMSGGGSPAGMVFGGGGGGVGTSVDMLAPGHMAGGGGLLGGIFGGGQGQRGPMGGGLSGISSMVKGFRGVNWGGLTRTPVATQWAGVRGTPHDGMGPVETTITAHHRRQRGGRGSDGGRRDDAGSAGATGVEPWHVGRRGDGTLRGRGGIGYRKAGPLGALIGGGSWAG